MSGLDPRGLPGRKIGDRRIPVERPHARYFRYVGPDVLQAKLEAQAPRTASGRVGARLRALLFGQYGRKRWVLSVIGRA
jgi:hypothetical protein